MLGKIIFLFVAIFLVVAAIFVVKMVTEDDYNISKKYDQYQYCKSYCNSIDNCDIVNSEITDTELICKYYQKGEYKEYTISRDEFE